MVRNSIGEAARVRDKSLPAARIRVPTSVAWRPHSQTPTNSRIYLSRSQPTDNLRSAHALPRTRIACPPYDGATPSDAHRAGGSGALFVEHDPVVVLTASVTTTTRVLPVLACAAVGRSGRGRAIGQGSFALDPSRCLERSRPELQRSNPLPSLATRSAPMRPLPCDTQPRTVRVFLRCFDITPACAWGKMRSQWPINGVAKSREQSQTMTPRARRPVRTR